MDYFLVQRRRLRIYIAKIGGLVVNPVARRDVLTATASKTISQQPEPPGRYAIRSDISWQRDRVSILGRKVPVETCLLPNASLGLLLVVMQEL